MDRFCVQEVRWEVSMEAELELVDHRLHKQVGNSCTRSFLPDEEDTG